MPTTEERHRTLDAIERFWATRPNRSLAQLIEELTPPGAQNAVRDERILRTINQRLGETNE